MSPTIEKMRETFRDSFMQPECFSGGAIEYELMESGLDIDIDKFYCRLSASGFLDCTDWHGPFDSVDGAADHLMDMYGEN
jgi:hypothetical protein